MLPDFSSEILNGETLEDAASLLKDFEELILVYDSKVSRLAGRLLSRLPLRAAIAVEASEKAKSFESVLGICRTLVDVEASRDAVIVALGGGITTDIAGFAASIYMRGIRYVNIPTTLLSQVDAAIGGKTGVNFEDYKNMLGAFRQPLFTFLCPEVLSTLPRREYLAGAAELLKTFIICNENGHLESAVKMIASGQSDPALILAAASVKAGIVSRDPFDRGERRLLNLGHTFAHAIEHEAAARGDDILHGEAVAMGLVLAARLSDRLGVSSGSESTIGDILRSSGIPFACPYPEESLYQAIRHDKKTASGTVSFVLPRGVGDVIIKAVTL